MEGADQILGQSNFGTLDWVIIIVYPLISLLIGLVARKSIRTMRDFICAGHSLGTALGIATLTGTELGLITVMYSAQKAFGGGFATFHIALVAGLVTFAVGVSGFIVFRLRKMKVLTVPEFYERRFGRRTRVLGGLMMALGGILNMGLFLKIGSMFIVGITGMSADGWALTAVMTSLIALVLVYTCLGGMVSVVITDYLQFVVLSFGMLLATWLAIDHLGWQHIFDVVREQKGLAGFDPTAAEGDFGLEYIWYVAFLGLVGCAIWPTSIARALAADSPQTVKKQFTWGSVSFLIRFMIPYFWGICAFVLIVSEGGALQELFFPTAEGVEPLSDLYALPVFLGRILPAGVIGLITAGMLSAFMSTHDSYLLCWSTVLTQDVIAPLTGDKMDAKQRIRLARILIVVIGVYVWWWGLFYEGSLDIFDYMGITGAIYFSGAFSLLLFGLYWKRASSTGAVLSLIAGASAVIGLGPVQDLLGELILRVPGALDVLGLDAEQEPLVSISPERVCLSSVGLTVVAMVVGSLLFPDPPRGESAIAQSEGGA